MFGKTQVHGSTGTVPFAFVSTLRLSSMASERLTRGQDAGRSETRFREQKNFLRRLDTVISLVWDTMEKVQARYKGSFDKRVQARRKTLPFGDSVFAKAHKNQWGKLLFKTLGPFPILKTDGRRLSIESICGIWPINGNRKTRAPEPSEGGPAC